MLWSGANPANDAFLSQYSPGLSFTVELFPEVSQAVPLSRDLVAAYVASLHDRRGEIDQAMSAVEQLVDQPWVRALRSSYSLRMKRPDLVISMTTGVSNIDDTHCLQCLQRGLAFRELGQPLAAIGAFGLALHFPARSAAVRHRAALERARTHLDLGHVVEAQRDVDDVIAEDGVPDGLPELLTRLNQRRA